MRRLHGIANSLDMGLSEHWELVMDREAWRAAVPGVIKRLTKRLHRTPSARRKDPRGQQVLFWFLMDLKSREECHTQRINKSLLNGDMNLSD